MQTRTKENTRADSRSGLGIGVCEERSPLQGMPGWYPGSWGYHADDGNVFIHDGVGRGYGPTYSSGDVVGCGMDPCTKSIFFTKNGRYLGEFQELTVSSI